MWQSHDPNLLPGSRMCTPILYALLLSVVDMHSQIQSKVFCRFRSLLMCVELGSKQRQTRSKHEEIRGRRIPYLTKSPLYTNTESIALFAFKYRYHYPVHKKLGLPAIDGHLDFLSVFIYYGKSSQSSLSFMKLKHF